MFPIDFPKRIEYLRNLQTTPISPSHDGSVNHDSLIFLARFACGQTENLFHVLGAIRCSGATPAQVTEVIDLLVQCAEELLDIESFPSLVAEKLKIEVVAHQIFPAKPPSQQAQSPIRSVEVEREPEVIAPVHSSPSPEIKRIDIEIPSKRNGPLTTLLMIFFGLFVFAVFLGFFVLWAREGWSTATKENPVGAALFFIMLGVIYVLAIPILKDKGYHALPKAMLWFAVAAGGLFIASHVPSCNNTDAEFPLDRPYHK